MTTVSENLENEYFELFNNHNIPIYSRETIEKISVHLLEYFKGGKYRFNEDATAQCPNHRTQKSNLVKAFMDYKEDKNPLHISSYLNCVLNMLEFCNPNEILTFKMNTRREKKDLKKEITRLKEHIVLLEEGQDGSKCGTCHYIIKEAIAKGVNDRVAHIEDDILNMDEYKQELNRRGKRINELDTERKLLGKEISSIEAQKLELTTRIEIMNNKINKLEESRSKKVKKKKKKKKKVVYVTDSESETESD